MRSGRDALNENRFRQSPLYRLLRALLGLAVVGAAAYYLGVNLHGGLSQIDFVALRARWPLILASGALTEFCVFLGTRSYHLILRGLGFELPYSRSARVHLVSNLGQFVPGYGWQQAGKVYLASREGIPVSKASVAMVVEQVMLAFAGLLVATVSFSRQWSWVPPLDYLEAYQAAAALMLMLALLLLPEALRRGSLFVQKRGKPNWELKVRREALWGAAGVMLTAWTLFGLAFSLIASAFHTLNAQSVLVCLFSLVASVLFGWAIPFVPGGIGVREGAMAFLLAAIMPTPAASLVAIVMRVVLVACELLGALVAWLAARREA